MNEDRISVIVPVHNVEPFLEYCVDSILAQSYKNLEIILVNNGSNDSSGEICKRYAELDSRVQVIDEVIGDVALARNLGIEKATGRYISFIDSDDYIHPDFYKRLHELIIENDVDIVECSYYRIPLSYKNKFFDIVDAENKKNGGKIEIYDNKKAVSLVYDANSELVIHKVVVWNKLYKKELWDNVRFPVGRLHEDDHTTYRALYGANKILSVSDVLYGYIQTKDSIMRKSFKEKRIDDTLSAYTNAAEFFNEHNEFNLEGMARRKYLEFCIELSYRVDNSDLNNKIELENFLRKSFIESYNKYIKLIKASKSDEKQRVIISIIEKAYNKITLEDVPLHSFWNELSCMYR